MRPESHDNAHLCLSPLAFVRNLVSQRLLQPIDELQRRCPFRGELFLQLVEALCDVAGCKAKNNYNETVLVRDIFGHSYFAGTSWRNVDHFAQMERPDATALRRYDFGTAALNEAYYGRPVRVASRDTVESECDQIIGSCVDADVALLVVGDSLCATTHADIALRARAMGAKVEVILNASVMAAVGKCGLQLYSYGATVSICFFEGEWRPTSFYDCLLYTSPSPRDRTRYRMPSTA